MIPYIGNFVEDASVVHYFNSFSSNDPSASVTITNLADTDIYVYKDGSITDIVTDGATVVIDFDGRTGVHKLTIDTSIHADYSIGSDYMVLIEGTTIDAGTVTAAMFTFSIENRHNEVDVVKWLGTAAATPTVAGVPEVDVTHVGGATTNVSALATNVDAINTLAAGATGFAAIDTVVDAVKVKTDQFVFTTANQVDAAWVSASRTLTAATNITSDGVAIDATSGTIDTVTAVATTSNLTTNNDKTGYGLLSTGADLILKSSTFALAIADAIWDEVLTGATHNISSSAGRRLRTLQTGGAYEGGSIWVDTVNGTAGTVDDENGVVGLPVDTWADALTLSASLGLKNFHIANGSTVTLSASSANYLLYGHEWTLALGGFSVASTMVIDATVSGTGTGAEAEFEDCIIGTMTIPPSQYYNCSFTGTQTLVSAGDYRYINCQSGIAGAGAPTFALGTGSITVEFRRWSGGINLTGIGADDTITISGELGTVDLGSATAGTVEIRGTYKALTNASSGVTVNTAGAILGGDVAAILVDTGTTIPATITTVQNDLDTLTGADGVIIASGTQTFNMTGNITGTLATLTTYTGNTLQTADVATLITTVGTAGAGLTDLGGMSTGMKAEVNVEAKDVLFTDTDAEPGQGTPAATASLAAKLGYLYKNWRNKKTQTATTWSLLNDDAATVDQKATVADDATTASKTEVITGP